MLEIRRINDRAPAFACPLCCFNIPEGNEQYAIPLLGNRHICGHCASCLKTAFSISKGTWKKPNCPENNRRALFFSYNSLYGFWMKKNAKFRSCAGGKVIIAQPYCNSTGVKYCYNRNIMKRLLRKLIEINAKNEFTEAYIYFGDIAVQSTCNFCFEMLYAVLHLFPKAKRTLLGCKCEWEEKEEIADRFGCEMLQVKCREEIVPEVYQIIGEVASGLLPPICA